MDESFPYSRLESLIDALDAEPLAIETGFAEMSVEELGNYLESSREKYETSRPSNSIGQAEFSQAAQSFEHCKELFCLFLQELELLNLTWLSSNSLSELKERGHNTQFIPATNPHGEPPLLLEEEEAPTEEIPQDLKTSFPLPTDTPSETLRWENVSNPPEREKEIQISTLEGVLGGLGIAAVSLSVQVTAMTHDEIPEEVKPSHLIDMSIGEENPEEKPTVIGVPEEISPPEISLAPQEQTGPKDVSSVEQVDPLDQTSLLRQTFQTAPTESCCQRAKDYLQLAFLFDAELASSKFPLLSEYGWRLCAQNLCFSLEAEASNKLKNSLGEFWKHRNGAVRSLLNLEAKRFELNPALKAAIDDFAMNHQSELFEGKFPYNTVLNSLRYIFALSQVDHYSPSLLEVGMFFFFFGQDASFNGMTLTNYLNLSGLSSGEIVELLFRLSRVQRLRSRALSVNSDFESGHLELLQEDTARCFTLLQKIHSQDNVPIQEVA